MSLHRVCSLPACSLPRATRQSAHFRCAAAPPTHRTLSVAPTTHTHAAVPILTCVAPSLAPPDCVISPLSQAAIAALHAQLAVADAACNATLANLLCAEWCAPAPLVIVCASHTLPSATRGARTSSASVRGSHSSDPAHTRSASLSSLGKYCAHHNCHLPVSSRTANRARRHPHSVSVPRVRTAGV